MLYGQMLLRMACDIEDKDHKIKDLEEQVQQNQVTFFLQFPTCEYCSNTTAKILIAVRCLVMGRIMPITSTNTRDRFVTSTKY
jgi:hypothetical protein